MPVSPKSWSCMMHRAIKKVGEDIVALRFNTAIAELIKLNNEPDWPDPKSRGRWRRTWSLMLAPFAPHIAEEIWEHLGHHKSLTRRPWPEYDAAKLAEATMELPVQVNGKVRDKITVSSDADESSILQAAEKSERVQPWLTGKTIQKRLYVSKTPGEFSW